MLRARRDCPVPQQRRNRRRLRGGLSWGSRRRCGPGRRPGLDDPVLLPVFLGNGGEPVREHHDPVLVGVFVELCFPLGARVLIDRAKRGRRKQQGRTDRRQKERPPSHVYYLSLVLGFCRPLVHAPDPRVKRGSSRRANFNLLKTRVFTHAGMDWCGGRKWSVHSIGSQSPLSILATEADG